MPAASRVHRDLPGPPALRAHKDPLARKVTRVTRANPGKTQRLLARKSRTRVRKKFRQSEPAGFDFVTNQTDQSSGKERSDEDVFRTTHIRP